MAMNSDLDRLREDLAYAVADAKRWHDAWQERGRIYEADTTALRAEVSRVREALQAAPTLAWMQTTQPWTAPYSPEFERSKGDEPHRSLTHDLLHVTKAVGILASIAEWADHGSVRTERVDQAEFEGRIADLVMCALHMVNNPPKGYGRFDLQRAVVERVERVNGVEWSCSTVRALDAALDGNEASE